MFSSASVKFSKDQQKLSVTIDTERLHMRSVEGTDAEYRRYTKLFGDAESMENFASGVRTPEQTRARVDTWVRRWQQGDPYSGFSVFHKETNEFLGHVVLGYSDEAGVAELAGVGFKKFWNQGYGTEAVSAFIKDYAPRLKENYPLSGHVFSKIVATAKADNEVSCRILEKMGMRLVKQEDKFGAKRNFYEIDLTTKGWMDSIYEQISNFVSRILALLKRFFCCEPLANGAR